MSRSRRRGSKDLPENDEQVQEALSSYERASASATESVPEDPTASPSAPSAPADGGGAGAPQEAAPPTDAEAKEDNAAVAETADFFQTDAAARADSTASASSLRLAAAEGTLAIPDRPSSPATEVLDEEEASEASEDFNATATAASEDQLQVVTQLSSEASPGADKRGSAISNFSARSDPHSSSLTVGQRFIREQDEEDDDTFQEDDDGENDMSGSPSNRRKAYFLEKWQEEDEDDYGPEDTMFDPELVDEEYIEDGQMDNQMFLEGDLQGELKGMVEINSNTMLSFLAFAILWVLGAAALLLSLTWHYVWVEVTGQADLAAYSAVEHGRLHASDVLSPATTLMKTLDLGFRKGSISSIGDYAGFMQVVEPFFQALPELRDVEMADTPEYLQYVNPGSIKAGRTPTGGVEIRSDRGDCSLAPGGRACTLEPLRANGSSWYSGRLPAYPHRWSPFKMDVAWDGPSFSRNLPHEAICDELCWSPTYSLAARISGGTDPVFVGLNQTYDAYRSVVARVTMEATIFVDVLTQVQIQSHGEAFICTDDGTVVAAVEMADTETADLSTGTVRMVKAWEFERPWASGLDDMMVGSGTGKSKVFNDFLVSAWKMSSPHSATDTLGDSLRLVVAVPWSAFADSVLQSMRWWFVVTSALPVVFIVLAAMVNLYLRFKSKGAKSFKEMTIAELKAINRRRRSMSSLRKSKSFLGRSRSNLTRGLSRSLSRTFSGGDPDSPKGGSMMTNWLVRRQTKSNLHEQKALADV